MEQLNRIKLKFINSIHYWIVGVAFATPFFSCSQLNLIENPNFEIYDTCPDNTFQITRSLGWWSYDFWSTPDYINTCSNHYLVGFPSEFGYQIPLSGNGYMHAFQVNSHYPKNFMFWTGNQNGNVQARESFGGTLVQELRAVPHKIEFYVNFTKYGKIDMITGNDGRVATNAFDLMLLYEKNTVFNSVKPYIDLNDVIKVYKGNNVINDTNNWVKISTCFIPRGGEKYFVVGAFRDTNEIVLEFSGFSDFDVYGGSYYYDNFSLFECDTCCLGEFPYTDHVNVSNNPSSSNKPTTFTIVLNANTSATLDIYDSAGRLVARNEFNDLLSNYQVDAQLAMGVYHYVLRTSNGVTDVGKVLVAL